MCKPPGGFDAVLSYVFIRIPQQHHKIVMLLQSIYMYEICYRTLRFFLTPYAERTANAARISTVIRMPCSPVLGGFTASTAVTVVVPVTSADASSVDAVVVVVVVMVVVVVVTVVVMGSGFSPGSSSSFPSEGVTSYSGKSLSSGSVSSWF